VEWIAEFADKVVALHNGSVLLEGKPQEVLTSDLLTDKAFGISRYTSVARKAQELGMWKQNQLPVTLDEAVVGFK
jgi:ABC-type hemin transport system ATPase subunit